MFLVFVLFSFLCLLGYINQVRLSGHLWLNFLGPSSVRSCLTQRLLNITGTFPFNFWGLNAWSPTPLHSSSFLMLGNPSTQHSWPRLSSKLGSSVLGSLRTTVTSICKEEEAAPNRSSPASLLQKFLNSFFYMMPRDLGSLNSISCGPVFGPSLHWPTHHLEVSQLLARAQRMQNPWYMHAHQEDQSGPTLHFPFLPQKSIPTNTSQISEGIN